MRLLCIFILLLLFFTDMIFAATLLETAKLNYNKFLNCTHTSSQKNIVVNDDKSNINITSIASSNNENIHTISDIEDVSNNAIFNNTNKNPVQDNSASDIENNSDDTGKLKV